jgi:hypothetical protein
MSVLSTCDDCRLAQRSNKSAAPTFSGTHTQPHPHSSALTVDDFSPRIGPGAPLCAFRHGEKAPATRLFALDLPAPGHIYRTMKKVARTWCKNFQAANNRAKS